MFVAILGDRKMRLPADWKSETVLAIAAEASFDASAGAGPGASITFVGVGGDLEVKVPPGSRVRESGFSPSGTGGSRSPTGAARRSSSRSGACSAT